MGRTIRTRKLFPAALEELMATRGVTFRELGAACGLSPGYLCHLAHGNRQVPDDETLARIAGAFDVGPDYFLEYRIRAVAAWLELEPVLADRLYWRLSKLDAADDAAIAETVRERDEADTGERISPEDLEVRSFTTDRDIPAGETIVFGPETIVSPRV